MNPNIHIYDTTVHLYEQAVSRIIEIGNETIAERGEFHMALAGGSTPRALYRCLGAPPLQQQLDWTRVHLWFGDERCVPPDDDNSNYRMARESLIERVPIPLNHVHRMEGELTPDEAAEHYGTALATLPHDQDALPVFDLILLGLGPDGHIASLFPDTPALSVRDRAVTALHVPQLDSWRLTLTLPVLNHARHLMLIVSGTKKADVIRHLFGPSHSAARALPVELLEPAPGALEWYLDQEAARYLHSELHQ